MELGTDEGGDKVTTFRILQKRSGELTEDGYEVVLTVHVPTEDIDSMDDEHIEYIKRVMKEECKYFLKTLQDLEVV